jgi:hypothetical protein
LSDPLLGGGALLLIVNVASGTMWEMTRRIA